MELNTKSKLSQYLEQRNISSVLNNTKWKRLFNELKAIEWLNIRALLSESKGALLQPEITDNSHLLLQVLNKAGTPFSMHKGGVRVWGYLRAGVNPEWANT